MKREHFQLPDNMHTPMVHSHYFAWLDEHCNHTWHHIHTRAKYLASLGYDRDKHYLTQDDITVLKCILHHHFFINVPCETEY